MSPLWHSVYSRACPRYGIRSTSGHVPVMAFDQFSGRVPVTAFGLLPGVSPLWHSINFPGVSPLRHSVYSRACPRYGIRSTPGRVPVTAFGLLPGVSPLWHSVYTGVSPLWHSINFCNDLSWDVGLLHNAFITYFIRLVRSGHVPVMAFDVTPGMPPSWHLGFLSSKPSPMNSKTRASMLTFCIIYTNLGNFGSRIHLYINSNTMSHSLSTPYTILFIHSLLRLVLP